MPQGEVEHEVTSLRRVFRERRIQLATMDRALRLATAGAGASLLATVLLLVLRDRGGGWVYLGRAGDAVAQISSPVFIAVLVLVALGAGYLFAAAALAAWSVAVPAVAVMVFGIGLYTGAFGSWLGGLSGFDIEPAWARWTDRGLLALLVLGAMGLRAWDHRRGRGPVTRVVAVLGFAAVVGAYLVVYRLALPTLGGLNLFGPTIDIILSSLVFVVYPLLQVAAVDFGEWGQLTGERLGHALSRGRADRLWLAAAVAAVAMAVYGGYQLQAGQGGLFAGRVLLSALRGVVLLALAIAVVGGGFYGLRLHRRSWPRGVNIAALVVPCALLGVVIPGIVASTTHSFAGTGRPAELASEAGVYAPGADVITLTGSHGPTAYSLQIPRGWVTHTNGAVVQASSYDGKGGYERIAAAVYPVADLATVMSSFHETPGATVTETGWEGAAFHDPANAVDGAIWVRPVASLDGSGTYVVYDAVSGSYHLDAAMPLFRAALASFRGDGTLPAPLPAARAEADSPMAVVDHQLFLEVTLGGITAAAALFVTVGLWRRWRPQAVAAAAVVAAITLFSLLYEANAIGHDVLGASAHVPVLSEFGVLFGAGVLGLGAVLVIRARGRHGAPVGRRVSAGVLGLLGALAALQLMTFLYDRALTASRVNIWAAVILLVAVAWDVTMSGESMTNHGTARLPRASRVLAFYGYVILTAGMVLFYSSERVVATGLAADPFFEPESVTRNALFRVALPVLVLTFFISLARGRAGAPVTVEDPGGHA